MIIKSMARKSASFRQLLSYISRVEKRSRALLHNLRCEKDDLAAISREFNANAQLMPPRKNGNTRYHEVLSFAAADREEATLAVLEDVSG